MLAYYLRHIRLTRSVPVLHRLAAEIELRFPDDSATQGLLGVIATRPARLAVPSLRPACTNSPRRMIAACSGNLRGILSRL